MENNLVEERFLNSIHIKNEMMRDRETLVTIVELADEISRVIKKGGKILTCGNGGSASDSLHIVGEFIGRFQKERNGYPAIALNADVATMTAIANDYGYDEVFSRQVDGLMKEGDLVLGISTSGNSSNVIKAFERAKELGGKTALLSGNDGGILKELADYKIIVPSDITARIQECHMLVYHILCEIVEDKLTSE